MEKKSIFEKAIEKWGEELQLIVTIEELAELQQSICHYLRKNRDDTIKNIVEEIVDVEIMLEQLKVIFSIRDDMLLNKRTIKLTRLSNRLGYIKEIIENDS